MTDLRSTQEPATAQHIAAWLTKLGQLVRKGPGDGSDQQCGLYAEMLLRDGLPKAAYRLDSLRYVAEQTEWWPSYANLRVWVDEHWSSTKRNARDNRVLQIAGPAPKRLDGIDLQWRNYWTRGEMTNWVRDGEHDVSPHEAEARRRNALSLIRSMSPSAYEAITGHPAYEAADQALWADVPSLRRIIARLTAKPFAPLVRILHAAVKRHAPGNLAIVEEAFPETAK
ncbi:hypothetical protein JUN65_08250 [Gluconacetobacter azotocaptans]|uniref:hypothetical protein n=1 Tax=Gluconacetobacter azotocaptans TaxID=142834 RepID=UPI00195DCC3A|nr:hypothetical protein [Gluconacetobacter azotocaptans]MBM9401576.1 hypothetical protein [Gluconacetobacter azotocaptans]